MFDKYTNHILKIMQTEPRKVACFYDGKYTWLCDGCTAAKYPKAEQLLNPAIIPNKPELKKGTIDTIKLSEYEPARRGAYFHTPQGAQLLLLGEAAKTTVQMKYADMFKDYNLAIHKTNPLAPALVKDFTGKVCAIILPIRTKDDYWKNWGIE